MWIFLFFFVLSSVFPPSCSEQVMKVLLIGDSGVGKTTLLCRMLGKELEEEPSATVAVDAESAVVEVDGVQVKLKIWDTAGQERMGFLTSSYYRGAAGVLVVFDIANQESFKNTPNWVGEIQRYAVGRDLPPVKMLIGNKSDLAAQRAVPESEGQNLVSSGDYAAYLETSAKDNVRVQDAFVALARSILEAKRNKASGGGDSSAASSKSKPKKQKEGGGGGGCQLL